ncbi:MAG: hypothetical protein ACREJX_12300, partial [Polyangiaceae bacterium]
ADTIEIVGSTQADPSGTVTVPISLPPKTEPGDLAIVILQARDGASVTAPTGFTSTSQAAGSCGGYLTTFLVKVVAEGEVSAGYTFTLSRSDDVGAILTAFRHATPIVASSIATSRVDADSTGHMPVGPISVSDPTDVQWLGVSSVYQSSNWGAPSGMTLAASAQTVAVFTSTGLPAGTTGSLVVQGPDENGGCGAVGFVSLALAR